MSPPHEAAERSPQRQPFFTGWTGWLAGGLFIYIPFALLIIALGDSKRPTRLWSLHYRSSIWQASRAVD